VLKYDIEVFKQNFLLKKVVFDLWYVNELTDKNERTKFLFLNYEFIRFKAAGLF
jgi:hypothetical protein